MNDYKDLVADLRNPNKVFYETFLNEESKSVESVVAYKAANAIEQLVSDYEILAKMYAKVNEDLCVRTKDRDDLERILSEVITERDKAIEDISEYKPCVFCKHYGESMCDYPNDDCFEWRGVRSEENVR